VMMVLHSGWLLEYQMPLMAMALLRILL
jgi:hypothetical protein